MRIFQQKTAWSLVLITLAIMAYMIVPTTALADTVTPGSGVTADPTYDEGIVYATGLTTAGDVVICESASPCSASDPSTWSDVLVFYNSANGAFVADSSGDANSAYVFSDDNGSLSTFLSNYNGLSGNHVVITENPTGLTNYANVYFINSPESTTPEPSSLALLASGLVGITGLVRRKIAR